MLPMLIDFPPGRFGLSTWSFHHARDHDEIAQAIEVQYNISLPRYCLDPMVFTNDSQFLLWNQQMHNDFNAVIQLPGSDISSLNFDDRSQVQAWLWGHFSEHRDAHVKLGI